MKRKVVRKTRMKFIPEDWDVFERLEAFGFILACAVCLPLQFFLDERTQDILHPYIGAFAVVCIVFPVLAELIFRNRRCTSGQEFGSGEPPPTEDQGAPVPRPTKPPVKIAAATKRLEVED
ncbi:MAG: hypothetical protein AAF492_03875 [Verrucomicrobiota bacterium]